MLDEKFEELNEKLDRILTIHSAIPEWYPITKKYAEECGYKTMDGLRKWCFNNLPPDDFIKKGKLWYIRRDALHMVKTKAV